MILETDRLILRRLTTDDAQFALELLNEPGFLEGIGDKGVRTLDDARAYLVDGPLASYARHGFGLWHVATKHDNAAIGMCGLLKRDHLDDADVGYAFLGAFGGKGYAVEAVAAVLEYARAQFGLTRIIAVVNPENVRSIRLLDKLGFRFERMVRMPGEEKEIRLLAREAPMCVVAG